MHRRNILSARTIISLILLIVAGLVVYTLLTVPPSAEAEVVALVGDEEITRHQVEVRIRQSVVRSQQGGLVVPEDALFDRSLDDLIVESLVYQDALKHGFSADQAEVEARYDAIRDNYDTEEDFLDRMEENLLTPEEFRTNIARQIVLFVYLEELKHLEVQAALEEALGANQDSEGPSLEITAERVELTQDDINRLANARADELREEIPVEVFID